MEKGLPFSSEQELLQLAQGLQTPFYLYDQRTIEAQCDHLRNGFSWATAFQNYFAVKATPNPHILQIIKEKGFGVDCSSYAELLLAETTGFRNEEIFFTANNATLKDYNKAMELGAILNLDDISHLKMLSDNNHSIPDHICFRYNPGPSRRGNQILGNPADAKFGLTKEQLLRGYEEARDALGCTKFSLHTMLVSNCLDEEELFQTGKMMFELVKEIHEKLNISIYRLNLGGGIGIPYKPEETPVDTMSFGRRMELLYKDMLAECGFDDGWPRLSFECGRFITGPAGVLITRVINKKTTYKSYLGVDASIANLMRPAMYGSYHHVTHISSSSQVLEPKSGVNLPVLDKETGVFDIVGSLCENNDKLATDRFIGKQVAIGDVLVFHDCGAHGSAMGFNYNGKLRCAEYLLEKNSAGKEPKLIRRAETVADLFATIEWTW